MSNDSIEKSAAYNKCKTNAENIDSFTDVRELQKQLKEQGIQIKTETNESSEGPAHFTLEDPDGNQILFDQHR